MELHDAHPALFHYPLAFFPLSVAADALAEALDDDDLRVVGRLTMPLAAAGIAAAGVSGLVAQEEVEPTEHGEDMLVTHRNLNLVAGAIAGGMALWRLGRDRVGPGYLGAGLAGLALMGYSAWLGGEMVYSHGIGVKDGKVRDDVPELSPDQADRAAARAAGDLASGARTVVEETAAGEVAPAAGGEH